MDSNAEGYQPLARPSPGPGQLPYSTFPPPPLPLLYPPYPPYPAYPQPPFGPGYANYPGPVAPSTNGFAIASLILSIGGFILLGFVGSALGVTFGHIARSQITRASIPEEGLGLANAGLIVGYIGLAYNILLLAACLFFFFVIPFIIAASAPSF